MNKAILSLIVLVLTFGGTACERSNVDEAVQAESDETTQDLRSPGDADETAPAAPARRSPPATPAPSRDDATDSSGTADTGARQGSQQQPQRTQSAPSQSQRQPRQQVASIPAGTAITVTLQDTISTETASVGDQFTANLTEPVVVKGRVLAEKGDAVRGRVQNVEAPGKVQGRARLELVLTEIMTDAKNTAMETEPFVVVAADNKSRDAAIIAGGAGAGAVIGAVTGGKKGAALGAIIGGGTGTTAVLVTRGEQIRLTPETRVNFVIASDIELPVIRRTNTN